MYISQRRFTNDTLEFFSNLSSFYSCISFPYTVSSFFLADIQNVSDDEILEHNTFAKKNHTEVYVHTFDYEVVLSNV